MYDRTRLTEDEEQMQRYDDMEYTPGPDVISVLLTPPTKGDNSTPWKTPDNNNTTYRPGIKRRLFSEKRTAEPLCDDVENTPLSKRFREAEEQLHSLSLEETKSHSVLQVVDRLVMREELIADGTRDHSLPIIPGKELKSISSNTFAGLLTGKFDNKVKRYTIIDCRYPYEFNGGHVKGAINLFTHQSIRQFLWQHMASQGQHVLIFHCEFSSERGPKLYRYLRSLDRDLNKDHYPLLHFPEIYLLEGGYKAFFQKHKSLCDPDHYTPMLHSDHANELRHFRAKSKSWESGDTSKRTRKLKLRSCSTVLF